MGEATTEKFAKTLAKRLKAQDVVLLSGTLGAGKTVFVRGLVDALNGARDQVTSPTFTIVKEYLVGFGKIRRVFHVDLYRLESDAIEDDIDLDLYLSDPEAVTVVEWAERLPPKLRPDGYWVSIDYLPDDSRKIKITDPKKRDPEER